MIYAWFFSQRRLGSVSLPASICANKNDNDDTTKNVPEFCIDAGSLGNVARFINHSCKPNLFVQCVLSSYNDIRLARIVLFASENISPYQVIKESYSCDFSHLEFPSIEISESPKRSTLVCVISLTFLYPHFIFISLVVVEKWWFFYGNEIFFWKIILALCLWSFWSLRLAWSLFVGVERLDFFYKLNFVFNLNTRSGCIYNEFFCKWTTVVQILFPI